MRNVLVFLVLSSTAFAEPYLDMGTVKFTGAPEGQRGAKIHSVVLKRQADFLACYSQELTNDPKLGEQHVHLTLIATADGKVTGAAAATAKGSATVATCVQTVAKTLQFPVQPEKTQIDYAFTFKSVDDQVYGGLLGTEAGETNGGFGYGRSGFGPGGGGTGWGTIGTGKYGTIGRGKGRPPLTAIGQPTATGDLDKAIIRRYVKRNIQKIEYCYEKQLLAKPGLGGKLTMKFQIAADGTVASSSADGFDPEVNACVASVVKGIEFPKPKSGGVVDVLYPITFKPSGT